MMSSTNRGKDRHRKDNYPTPAWCVDRLLDAKPKFIERMRSSVDRPYALEPCAGDGAIIKAFMDHPFAPPLEWSMVEIRKAKKVKDGLMDLAKLGYGEPFAGQDFFKFPPPKEPYDLAITNPPFSVAWEMLHRCWEICDHICFLLRLNFFGSELRHEWLQKHMPDVYILPNRPRFAKNKDGVLGSDSIEYAWFHWDTGIKTRKQGKTTLLDLTLRETRKEQEPK